MNRTERIFVTGILALFAVFSIAALILFSWSYVFGDADPSVFGPSYISFIDTLDIRIISAGIHTLILLAGGASISIVLRKSNYPELSFYIFGMLSYAGISIYNISPLLLVSGYPVFFSTAAIRLFYLCWCLGTLFFFLAGLFPNGVSSQKQHSFLLSAVLVSLISAVIVPVDARVLLSRVPFTLTGPNMLPWIIRVFALLGILNFIAAGMRSSSSRYYFASLGLMLLFTANELFFIPQIPALIAASLLTVSATVLYSIMIYREYLWT